tara:strand:- start:93 stop:485 length:393 start_codon:yes stop_codon:yes gene_type:complete
LPRLIGEDMKKLLLLGLAAFVCDIYASDYNYLASEHELIFKDGAYEQTEQRVVIGRNITLDSYQVFGEIGFGEDITEGQSIGSGSDYDYYKVGFETKYFDSLDLGVEFESKLNSLAKDNNQLKINTKYTF